MHVLASFEYSTYLELALRDLEEMGIGPQHILAVPLDKRQEQPKLFDTLHRSDGLSLFDLGAALATALAVIGASVGFQLTLGPIIWGLIGAASGFVLGVLLNLVALKLRNRARSDTQGVIKGKQTEVILLIRCEAQQVHQVEKVLWERLALGVGKLRGS